MRVGTKSLLLGVHQGIWHSWTVARAWRFLYGRWPNFYEAIAILAHDIGYWGCKNLDGSEGKKHPVAGARFVGKTITCLEWLRLFFKGVCLPMTIADWKRYLGVAGVLARHTGMDFYWLTLLHSRHFARLHNVPPSKLCWADKYCVVFDPAWCYLFRARLSGEIKEFRRNAVTSNHVAAHCSDKEWFEWYVHRAAWLALDNTQHER